MDVQMVIPVPAGDTSVKSHIVPVVVSHTNASPLSHAALRDPNLVKDLQSFATRYGLNLHQTFPTGSLLRSLLYYQITYEPKEAAATRIQTAIKVLEAAWYIDIRCWVRSKSLSLEDPITGEVVWSHCLTNFVKLILQPLQTRMAYIFFDGKGDISGKCDTVGIWRLCRFHSYRLHSSEKSLELYFKVNNQIKGLVLQFNDIKKFNEFGIYFWHPAHPDRVLFNPFSCIEFDQPSPGSDQRWGKLDSEIRKIRAALAREEPTAEYVEVCLNNPPPSLWAPSRISSTDLTVVLHRA
jgi:hypothetical protein